MKKLLSLFLLFSLCSCQRSCQKLKRGYQAVDRQYTVCMFSGGDTVFVDQFKGIIENNDSSDGVYYFKGDTLIEISGDYIIISE